MVPTSKTSKPALFFVINGGSGHQDLQATLGRIETAVSRAGREHHVFVIKNPASIADTLREAVDAAKAQGGVLAAVGGDGTINAVASAALAAGCLFGAIPRGTFNYFGRNQGIPEDIDGALEDLLQGEAVPVQVGMLNEHVFLVNASVGLYSDLLEDREQYKRRYGRSRLVALWSAVITAFGRHRHLDMVLEQGGERVNLRTSTLFVGNNRLQLEQVGMPQAESLNQGQLAAIALKPAGTPALLWLGARGALGKLADADNVIAFSFRRLTVMPLSMWRGMRRPRAARASDRPAGTRGNRIKVAMDGEIRWLQVPLEFRVGNEPLMLIKRSPDPAAVGCPERKADDP